MRLIRNNAIVSILLCFISTIFGMDIENNNFFPFDALADDLKREIVFINLKNEIDSLLTDDELDDYEKLDMATKRLIDFVVVNKSLSNAINNTRFCFKFIKNVAPKFGMSDEDVAIMLGISAARQCMELQNDFITLVSGKKATFSIQEFERLCNEGADINWTDSEMQTPLMHAVLEDQLEAVKALILKGADVNYSTDMGLSVFDMTINKDIEDDKVPVVIEIINILLQRGADPKKSLVLQELLNDCNQPAVVKVIKEALNKK